MGRGATQARIHNASLHNAIYTTLYKNELNACLKIPHIETRARHTLTRYSELNAKQTPELNSLAKRVAPSLLSSSTGVHQQPIWHFMQYREARRSHNNHLQRVVVDPRRQAQDSFCWMEIGRPPTTGCSIGVGHFPLNLYNVTNCARHSRPLSEFVPINVVDKSL